MYFLRLGTFGFGGPIALAGYMQRDLVERRRWISKQDYMQGLALAQLAPGPLAAQLAMYLGWVEGGVLAARPGGGARSSCRRSSWCSGSRRSTCATAACPGCRACSTASARRSSPSSRAARIKLVRLTLGQRPAAVGPVRRQRGGDRVDRIGDHLAVPGQRRRGARRPGAAALACAGRRRRVPAGRRQPLGWLSRGRGGAVARVAAAGRSPSTSPRRARSCSAAAWRSSRSCTAAS